MGEEGSVNNYNTHNTRDSTNSVECLSSSEPTTYFRYLSLSYFVVQPFEFQCKHNRLKALCLENGNLEAHYVEGILQFFFSQNKSKGLFHLRQSSKGSYKNGTYLYGLMMLALAHYEKGQKYLDKLKRKEDLSTSDRCWGVVKRSLSTIPNFMKKRYHTAIINLRPRTCCHHQNETEICENCYYYKQLERFVDFAIDQE